MNLICRELHYVLCSDMACVVAASASDRVVFTRQLETDDGVVECRSIEADDFVVPAEMFLVAFGALFLLYGRVIADILFDPDGNLFMTCEALPVGYHLPERVAGCAMLDAFEIRVPVRQRSGGDLSERSRSECECQERDTRDYKDLSIWCKGRTVEDSTRREHGWNGKDGFARIAKYGGHGGFVHQKIQV